MFCNNTFRQTIISAVSLNLSFNSIYSLPKKCVSLLVAMLFISINPAHAEDSVPDKFKITLGGYSVFRYDATMSLSDPVVGGRISISPEDTPGLDNEQTVLRLTGYYRFTKEHALTFSSYRISSQGNKTLTEEFNWLDENGNQITIPVGQRLTALLITPFLKLVISNPFIILIKLKWL